MHKTKGTPKEKIEAVESYLHGEASQRAIAERLNVTRASFRWWIRKYQTFGTEGLLKRSHNQSYTAEDKKAAVEEYFSGNGSQADICKRYKIHFRKQLQDWIKMYNGHSELQSGRSQGSDVYMTKERSTTYEEQVEIVSYCIEHGNNYAETIEKYGISYQQIYNYGRRQHRLNSLSPMDYRSLPEAAQQKMESHCWDSE